MSRSTGATRRHAARASTARTARLLAAIAAAVLAAPRALRAQPVLGVGEDATLPAPGEIRVRVPLTFGSARERAGGRTGGGSGRVPLGTEFGLDSITPARLPGLAPLRDAVRAAAAVPALGVSLGTLQTRARLNTSRAPVLVELGLRRRLALSVLIPYTQTRTTVDLAPNVGGGAGNLGLSPVRGTDAAATAAQNATAAALKNIADARAQALARCPTATASAGCATTFALATSAEQFRTQLATVYGTGTPASGLAFVPLANSDAQRAIAQRIAQLGAQFASAGITGFDPNAVPAPSRARIGFPALQALLNDPANGVALGQFAPPLNPPVRGGLGDVELGASFMLVDGFGGAGRTGALRARVTPSAGLRVRSTVSGAFRFATGLGASPFFVFQVPPADQAAALVARSATDLVVGRRASASLVARVALPVADRRTLLIPLAPGDAFAPAYARQEVSRRLGREVELEVTPRYATSESFAFVAQGVVRDRAAARFTGTYTLTAAQTGADPVTLDASALGLGTGGREVRFGVGANYSTLAAASRRASRLPVEVGYLHGATLAASGGAVPYTTFDQLTLRVYAPLFGR